MHQISFPWRINPFPALAKPVAHNIIIFRQCHPPRRLIVKMVIPLTDALAVRAYGVATTCIYDKLPNTNLALGRSSKNTLENVSFDVVFTAILR